MDTDFDVKLRGLLDAKRGDWPRIAVASGVSYSWLSQFARNKIPNPGFETLKRLYQELTPDHPAPASKEPSDAV